MCGLLIPPLLPTQEIYMSPVWQELHGEVGAEEPHEAAHGREAVQVHLAHLPLFFPHGLCHEGPLQDSHRFETRFSLGPRRLAEVRKAMAEREPISKTLAFQGGACFHPWFLSHRTWSGGRAHHSLKLGFPHLILVWLSFWDDCSNTTDFFNEVHTCKSTCSLSSSCENPSLIN